MSAGWGGGFANGQPGANQHASRLGEEFPIKKRFEGPLTQQSVIESRHRNRGHAEIQPAESMVQYQPAA